MNQSILNLDEKIVQQRYKDQKITRASGFINVLVFFMLTCSALMMVISLFVYKFFSLDTILNSFMPIFGI